MKENFNNLKNICEIPNNIYDKVNMVVVDTLMKIDISSYTDMQDVIIEYNNLPYNDFKGLFVPPGNIDKYTIFINSQILNTNQFFITATHELCHCKFNINNANLLQVHKGLLGYNMFDEFYARFNSYKIGYTHKLFDDFIFETNDCELIENLVNERILKKLIPYEFISLFATMFFAEKIRNLKMNYFKAFSCFDKDDINNIYEILCKVDFTSISTKDLLKMENIISKMFN